tara:strand:+ start:81 stop:530 length:450 start_codon:yes stop_codon:yes gene_type:complete
METKTRKYDIIQNWKKSGVKYDDFDELYYVYIRTLKCSACNKDFKNSFYRCLDHDHETGLFRAIVCRSCNGGDSYIKYPDGFDIKIYKQKNKERIYEVRKKYREKNKLKIKEEKLKKYDCECGGNFSHSQKSRHLKTIKHIDWYMEQVD